jgi:hypothetical protein
LHSGGRGKQPTNEAVESERTERMNKSDHGIVRCTATRQNSRLCKTWNNPLQAPKHEQSHTKAG